MTTRYMTTKELSKYTSLPVRTLHEWARNGRIPSVKMGRMWLFDQLEIDKTIASNKHSVDRHEMTPVEIVGGVAGDSL